MFERFTDRSRRVVVLAQEEARLLNHDYIGTEHILLGIVREEDGVGARALAAMGMSLAAVRAEVEAIIGQGEAAPTGHIPFTPRAKKVLELALREAIQLGHKYIGTEHILLGLVREGEGVAAQVLVKLGANLNRIRQTVIRLLSGYSPGEVERTTSEGSLSAEPTPAPGPTCPWCHAILEASLVHRTLLVPPAEGKGEPIPLVALYCTACGGLVRTSMD